MEELEFKENSSCEFCSFKKPDCITLSLPEFVSNYTLCKKCFERLKNNKELREIEKWPKKCLIAYNSDEKSPFYYTYYFKAELGSSSFKHAGCKFFKSREEVHKEYEKLRKQQLLKYNCGPSLSSSYFKNLLEQFKELLQNKKHKNYSSKKQLMKSLTLGSYYLIDERFTSCESLLKEFEVLKNRYERQERNYLKLLSLPVLNKEQGEQEGGGIPRKRGRPRKYFFSPEEEEKDQEEEEEEEKYTFSPYSPFSFRHL